MLSQLKPGEPCTVELIGRNISSEKVPDIGQALLLKSISLDKTVFTIEYDGKSEHIPVQIAENLWVKKC